MGAVVVYGLSAITALICSVLLLRSYRAARTRLIFWTAFCFGFIFLNNVALVFDLLVASFDFGPIRLGLLWLGAVGMLFGLIWDSI